MGSLTKVQQSLLKAALAVLVGGVIGLQAFIDPLRSQAAIEPKNINKAVTGFSSGAGLPFEYALGAVSGFRQVIAGLLWVRSDSFFHQGNYDAILPLIRMITWMDPNWLDPYATGAWHLTYNFTDTDQRSDRRYLPTGVALLNEGIENNKNIYDMYKEKGWLNFDKIKDYDQAILALKEGFDPSRKPDTTQVGHLLAQSYEKAGRLDEAIAQWEECIRRHEAEVKLANDKSGTLTKATQGLESAKKNLRLLKIRKEVRPRDTKPPIDADFKVRVVRVKPKVLEISGSWNLIGCKPGGFDDTKGIVFQGPVDGARVLVRLHDAGYKMPEAKEFSFEVDSNLTIMQDELSTRGGKKAEVGGLFVKLGKSAVLDRNSEKVEIYGFTEEEAKGLGVPIDQALAGAAPLSEKGKLQAVMAAYPLPYGSKQILYTAAEVGPLFAKLKADSAMIASLKTKGFHVATRSVLLPGEYSRAIDMSKDPKMYGFKADKYDLIVSFNPRTAPDFIQDRLGYNGEGLTDKKYLDTTTIPGTNMLRAVIPLTREDIEGEGRKVLYP